MKNKLIFIELNEINFDLIKQYSKEYKFKVFDENFFNKLKRTRSEIEHDLLEPWIQWASIHTGLSAKEHNIFRLGDFPNSQLTNIFKEVEKKGYTVGAICPMNVSNNLENTEYFIPDPWIKNQEPKKYLQKKIYLALSEAVNKNAGSKVSFKSNLIIILSIIFYVRKKYFYKLFYFLIKSLKYRWYRALIFDFFINELHIKYLKKFKKDFSTIFFNAGAHIQHHYLKNSKLLNNHKIPSQYLKKSPDPILETYIFYDNLLHEYFKLKNCSILIATGLTQTPYDQNTYYYRLSDHEQFLKVMDVNFENIEPRMSRDFLVKFENNEQSISFVQKMLLINELNNDEFFRLDNRGRDVFVSLVYPKEIYKDFKLKINKNLTIDFFEYVNFVAIKNGEHSPLGFMFANGLIEKLVNNDNFHVKEIYNIINNYFKR